MPNIKVTLKSGYVFEIEDRGAPGGSWCASVRYKGAFVIVQDAYGKDTAFPAEDVERVEKEGGRRW